MHSSEARAAVGVAAGRSESCWLQSRLHGFAWPPADQSRQWKNTFGNHYNNNDLASPWPEPFGIWGPFYREKCRRAALTREGGKYRNSNLKTGIMAHYRARLTSDFEITAARDPGSQGRAGSDFFPDYEFCTNMPPTRPSDVPHLMRINLIGYAAWSEP